jgi:hypothetical protein
VHITDEISYSLLQSARRLVVAGLRPMYAASATLENPFDRNKHIIAQALSPAQRLTGSAR